MKTNTLTPGDKLLHNLTHESLTYVEPFDDQQIIVADRCGDIIMVDLCNVSKDWDRIIINKIVNIWKRLFQRN